MATKKDDGSEPVNAGTQKTSEDQLFNSDLYEKALARQNRLLQERLALAQTQLEKQIIQLEYEKNISDLRKEEYEYLNDSLKRRKELTDQEFDRFKILQQEFDKNKDITEEKAQQLLETIKIKNEEKQIGDSISNNLISTLGLNNANKTMLGTLIKAGMEGKNLGAIFGQVGEKLAESLKPANVFASIVSSIASKSLEMFTTYDKTFSQFEKTVGGVDAFKGRIETLRDTNIEYALSIEEAGTAFSDLKSQFAGFAGVSVATQDALAKTTAQMTKLGVASGDTIKIQNMLVKGFQMTGEQAGAVQQQLMATAKAMNLPMQQVVKEFANASNGLKAHGASMQKVFLDLQNQSKNLGIEFSRLQDITGQFDTFDGAADAAGKLNAILGGDYLNSIQLLNADEAERVRIMQDSLKASGKSFEAMSKQEKMATANALGLKDVTELQQMMNNTTQEGAIEALNRAQAEKELAKSVQDVTTMQEKLTAIMSQFAIVIIPVLDGIKYVLTEFGKLMSEYPVIKYAVLGLIVVFVLLFSILKGAQIIGGLVSGFTNFKDTLKGVKKPAEDAGGGVASAINKIGRAATRSKNGLLALGATMLMIGGGIALAAVGLAELVKAFQGLTGEQVLGALGALIIIMGGFAIMINILAGASLTAIGPMLALGAAFLLIGGGIYLAAVGMAQLVQSFAGLGENAPIAALAVAALGLSMVLVTYALVGAIPAALAAGAAFGEASIGFALFGLAISLVGIGIGAIAVGLGFLLKNVGDMFEKINNTKPENISKSMSTFFDSITLTGIGKVTSFAIAVNSLNEQLYNLNSQLAGVVQNMTNLDGITTKATVSVESAATTTTVPAATVSTTTAAAKATAANTTTSSAAGSNIVPVAIYIDSKKVGEILDPRYKKMIQDKLDNIDAKTVPV